MTYYKLWLHIEEFNDDDEPKGDVGLPAALAKAPTLEVAEEMMSSVEGLVMDSEDPCWVVFWPGPVDECNGCDLTTVIDQNDGLCRSCWNEEYGYDA